MLEFDHAEFLDPTCFKPASIKGAFTLEDLCMILQVGHFHAQVIFGSVYPIRSQSIQDVLNGWCGQVEEYVDPISKQRYYMAVCVHPRKKIRLDGGGEVLKAAEVRHKKMEESLKKLLQAQRLIQSVVQPFSLPLFILCLGRTFKVGKLGGKVEGSIGFDL